MFFRGQLTAFGVLCEATIDLVLRCNLYTELLYYLYDNMRRLIRMHSISFKHAYEGLWWAVRTQPNFRVHITLSVLALVLGAYLHISPVEYALIVFTIVLGISAEMINTSLESMTDLITQKWRKEAKIAKDVSAGMMLTVAIGAIIVAGIIFVPKLLTALVY